MKRKVVLITDCVDVALLEMRGVIHKYANGKDFEIEPIVEVQDFSIENASFLTRLIADIYPDGTILAVIVNPAQRRPERLVGRTEKKNLIFEGPNTGAFDWLVKDFGVKDLYEISDPGFVPFGGKYVHSPTIGKIIAGKTLESLGKPFNPEMIRKSKIETGTILHIDNFGNLKIKMSFEDEDGSKYLIKTKNKEFNALYWTRMMEKNDGEIIVYPGSSLGLIEVGIVRGSFADYSKVRVGEKIRIVKEG